MDKTYVVYCEEYYFNTDRLVTILKKNIYNISNDIESAEEVKYTLEGVLEGIKCKGKMNANNELLTTYKVELITLEGKYTLDEVKSMLIDDDYTWGHTSKR